MPREKSVRRGMVLVLTLVLLGCVGILFGAVIGYVMHATRLTAIHVGNSVCRLAAQGEIELAKAAISDAFSRSVARGAHIIGTMGATTCSFDWFGVGDRTETTRTIGTRYGANAVTILTLDEASTNSGCIVRVRIRRVNHPSNTQWAEVTLVAAAERTNPGGTVSRQAVEETVRFAQGRSKVFNNAYFVNNYGWFQGTGCTANGDVRANGDMYLDSGCKVNGRVFAARNEELNVRGDVTNYGTMDSYSTYQGATYGVANLSRPLATDPQTGETVPGGYEAPKSPTTADKRSRVHGNEERETEMPFIGDLTSPSSDYRLWVEELRAGDPNMCKLKQNGRVLIDGYFDGTGPSGNPNLADRGAIVLEGTKDKPLVVNGPVIVKSDVIIKGYVSGQGTIYAGRNIHIVGNVQYVNPPSWSGKKANPNNGSKDMLGLMAKGNIVMGDYTASDWHSIDTYLTQQPYVQRYKCDATDDLIGYPDTFGGNYVDVERVTTMGALSDPANAPGGWDRNSGHFGKVREVQLDTYHNETVTTKDRWGRTTTTTTRVRDVGPATTYDRKYFETVCLDREISSRVGTITRIDAVLYNNHGIFGKLGKCTVNGSLVCRNEGLQYSSNLYLNWDIRLYSGSSESVDNNQVGLAKASDSPPTVKRWRLIPYESVPFVSSTIR